METLWHNLRFAVRMLAKNPGFTLIAVLVLGLGIGANTAIFSVVHAVLLRPLPYPESDKIYVLTETRKEFGEMSVAYPNYLDWRASQHAFEDLACYRRADLNLTGDGEPERLRGGMMTANYFKVMSVAPLLGRTFSESEDKPGGANVVVLSEGIWRGRFAADPNVLGRSLTLNGISYEIVGVMPASLVNPRNIDLYIPIGLFAERESMKLRGNHPGIYAMARLKKGASAAQAKADFEVICKNLEAQYPDSNATNGVTIRPLLEVAVGEYRATLWLLLGAVAFVLLIACANLANLLLARAASRSKEIAVRAALGASRARIIGQLLTESVLLALLGGGLGLLLALWGVDAIRALSPQDVPRFQQVRVDGWVLAFMATVSIGTGFLFGLFPAWKISRADLNSTLKEAGRGTAGTGRQGSQGFLVISQVAIACVLLIGAGLLLKSFQALQNVRLGFEPGKLLTVQISLPGNKYRDKPEEQNAFYRRLLETVAGLPGVRDVALSNNPPFSGGGWQSSFAMADQPDPKPGEEPSAEMQRVSGGYFKTMGMPILRGRPFDDAQDVADKPPVAIIDEAFARRFFPGQDPIGKLVNNGPLSQKRITYTVVGVVPTMRHDEVTTAEPKFVQMYLPSAQDPVMDNTLLVRSAGDPLTLARAVRNAVLAIDPTQPVFDVRSMDSRIAESLATNRLSAILVGLFSALALGLAAVGLYGTMAYAVARRTREIGIRLALGAQRAAVFALVVRQGMTLVVIGLIVGLFAAVAFGQLLASFLFGVGSRDPLTLGAVALVLGTAALLACWFPARRATRVDPIVALREE